MSDLSAVPLQAQELSAELASSFATRTKAFLGGLLFAAAVAFVGVAVVAVALVVGVVGAPVVAVAAAALVYRHRHHAPAFSQAP